MRYDRVYHVINKCCVILIINHVTKGLGLLFELYISNTCMLATFVCCCDNLKYCVCLCVCLCVEHLASKTELNKLELNKLLIFFAAMPHFV